LHEILISGIPHAGQRLGLYQRTRSFISCSESEHHEE
jgi:hypothetical protein